MMHDFAVTENHVVFGDWPYGFDLMRPLFFDQPLLKLNQNMTARYGVMNKYGKDIKWFEFPSHFVFHFINSWEDGDIIKIFGCV